MNRRLPVPATVSGPGVVLGVVAIALYVIARTTGAGWDIVILSVLVALLLVATVWAASLGQSTVAGIFGVFAGFWLSYAALVLGLTHGWYGVAPEDVTRVVGTYLICWTVVVRVLTLVTLRLPAAFTALLGLVTVALALVTLAGVAWQSGATAAEGAHRELPSLVCPLH